MAAQGYARYSKYSFISISAVKLNLKSMPFYLKDRELIY